MKNRNTKKR